MEKETLDSRKQYSRMIIQKSLIDIMQTKPITTITVTLVCRKAHISRGTFYLQYADPYAVLREIEDNFFQEIEGTLKNTKITDPDHGFLVSLLSFLAQNKETCMIIFNTAEGYDFLQKIMALSHDISIDAYKKTAPESAQEKIENTFTFVAGGIMSVIQSWVKNGMKQAPEELAQFLTNLNIHCILQLKQGVNSRCNSCN